MTGRTLGASLLIGAVSGVVVTVMAAALSGSLMMGLLEGSTIERPSRSPSGNSTPMPSGSAPSAGATVAASTGPTPTPTPIPEPPTAEQPTARTAEPAADPTDELTVEDPGVKAGLPVENGSYGVTTPVVTRGQYISWRAIVGAAGSGEVVDVEVATRLNGSWTGWSRLTTRVVDPDGTVTFSWRQETPAWISVRFALPSGHTTALQGRWR